MSTRQTRASAKQEVKGATRDIGASGGAKTGEDKITTENRRLNPNAPGTEPGLQSSFQTGEHDPRETPDVDEDEALRTDYMEEMNDKDMNKADLEF